MEVHLAVFAEVMSTVKNKIVLEQYNFASALHYVLNETKPLALAARLGFTLRSGRKAAATPSAPFAAAAGGNKADVSQREAELAKELKKEIGEHNRAKSELAQLKAKTTRLEAELKEARAKNSSTYKRDRSPDRRQSGDDHGHYTPRRR